MKIACVTVGVLLFVAFAKIESDNRFSSQLDQFKAAHPSWSSMTKDERNTAWDHQFHAGN
jgi:hypothetical protein